MAPGQARQLFRRLRRQLPAAERRAAEHSIRRELLRLGLWRRGRRIALYLGLPGEVDLRPCFDDAWAQGVRLYVPRIRNRRTGEMSFVPLQRGKTLRRNSLRIEEPAAHGRVALLSLDAVLVPLVAFDARGHRLGMGAGFYDRALRRRLDGRQSFRRPRLIGVAYAIQQAAAIERAPWDVALDLVVTERGVIRCDSHPPAARKT
ncbi:MAG TPA: 5-formyltetrahydrofolate cyclo-ligase [Steroidobacteraceae bacterium]